MVICSAQMSTVAATTPNESVSSLFRMFSSRWTVGHRLEITLLDSQVKKRPNKDDDSAAVRHGSCHFPSLS